MLQYKNANNRPIIIIANYLSKDAAKELKEEGINYLDRAGNAYVRFKDLFFYIQGQKGTQKAKGNKSRAFQEAGIKILFNILSNPQNLQLSYRELSSLTKISIGSVSNVMKELEDLDFILKTSTKRVLKNKKELLERWLIAYSDILKPRIFKKRMRLSNKDWKSLNLNNNNNNGICLWGGEPAAALLTGQLKPELFTIYTNANWQELIPSLGLVPDEEGNVEIRQLFWQNENSNLNTIPPLLIYADLATSRYSRNNEIANKILENELPDFN